MGATWSEFEHQHMRLASPDLCDAQTWANTIQNRSSCSVRQRLSLLKLESLDDSPSHQSYNHTCKRRLAFAPIHTVRIFIKDVFDYDVDSSDDDEPHHNIGDNDDEEEVEEQSGNELEQKSFSFDSFVQNSLTALDNSLQAWWR